MTLYINSSDKNKIIVELKKHGKVKFREKGENEYGSQILLPLIKKIIEKNGFEFPDLKEIEVETGPGSFTGLRVGVSVANALGFSLGIPVNGKKIETELVYG